MSKKANPAVVGSFVLVAIVLSVVGIMVLGGASYFDERFECIMYFDESISGLDVGAPVDFQGVRIGTVTDVRLEVDARAEGGEMLRPVRMQLEGNRINYSGERKRNRTPDEGLEMLVTNRGLRARLAAQSMLTGKLKVELGYFPDYPIVRKNHNPDVWEMPTIPSAMRKVVTEFTQLPIGDIVSEAHRAVQRMAQILDPELTGKTMNNLNDTLVRLESILVKVESNVEPLFQSLTRTSDKVSSMLDPGSDVRGEISQLIAELRETSKSMRRLTEYLEQHPESILRGKNQ